MTIKELLELTDPEQSVMVECVNPPGIPHVRMSYEWLAYYSYEETYMYRVIDISFDGTKMNVKVLKENAFEY